MVNKPWSVLIWISLTAILMTCEEVEVKDELVGKWRVDISSYGYGITTNSDQQIRTFLSNEDSIRITGDRTGLIKDWSAYMEEGVHRINSWSIYNAVDEEGHSLRITLNPGVDTLATYTYSAPGIFREYACDHPHIVYVADQLTLTMFTSEFIQQDGDERVVLQGQLLPEVVTIPANSPTRVEIEILYDSSQEGTDATMTFHENGDLTLLFEEAGSQQVETLGQWTRDGEGIVVMSDWYGQLEGRTNYETGEMILSAEAVQCAGTDQDCLADIEAELRIQSGSVVHVTEEYVWELTRLDK